MSVLTYATQSSYDTKFLTAKYISPTAAAAQHTTSTLQQLISKYITHYTQQQQYIICELLHNILRQPCTLTNDADRAKVTTLHNICIQHILHTVHIATTNTEHQDLSATIIQHFDSLVIQHSVERPPYSIAVFALSDIKLIAEYYDTAVQPHILSLVYAFEPVQQVDVHAIDAAIAEQHLQQLALAQAEEQNSKNKVKRPVKAVPTVKA